MAKVIGGFRRKTRHKLSRPKSEKGKISIRKFFQEFDAGAKVSLVANPALQKGMYFPRFHGKVGVIGKKKGRCYEVLVKDGSKQKSLIVHPLHLRRL